ncbi:zinc-dependent alcohol dehydrogenase [Spirillospora sp. CA-294931]|uniref:zinc-dependent alcohol dehydrogenase n=1 Tax=Spirillospora sp. CA-294931 TaxID=3240042 RepID=UPI003D9094C1
MRSLCLVEPGRVEWRDAPEPRLSGGRDAIVAPVASGRCDWDRSVVAGVAPFRGPFAIGHEGVARVVDVGERVAGVVPGDLVVVPPHISCGECGRCRGGLTAHCEATPPGAAFGVPGGGTWGGMFDDLVRVPYADTMLTPVPDGVAPVDAVTAADSLSLGYAIISGQLAAGRRSVAVFGFGDHGLFQTAFAVALGAETVVYIDDDPDRRALAEDLGAHAVSGPPDRAHGAFDLIVDAAGDLAWLRRAVHLLEPGGVIECLGGYFGDIPLAGFAMYTRGVSVNFGQGNNLPAIPATLDAVARGLVRPSELWITRVDWDDLPAAYVDEPRKLVATV